jgi:hypothetical protein
LYRGNGYLSHNDYKTTKMKIGPPYQRRLKGVRIPCWRSQQAWTLIVDWVNVTIRTQTHITNVSLICRLSKSNNPYSNSECICLFVCFGSQGHFLSHLLTVAITDDRAANLDLCLALTAFSSEGCFTCHTYCDMGPPFF